MKYFVREALDKPIKGVYDDLYEACKNSNGLDVYDENGDKVVERVSLKDHKCKIVRTNYDKAWSCLKEFYQYNLETVKAMRESNKALSEVAEMFYNGILDKMKELEEENTIILKED